MKLYIFSVIMTFFGLLLLASGQFEEWRIYKEYDKAYTLLLAIIVSSLVLPILVHGLWQMAKEED